MSFWETSLAGAPGHARWSSSVALLTIFHAVGCGGVVEHEIQGDPSVFQPDAEASKGGDAGGSVMGDAARADVEVPDLAVCETFTTQACRLRMRCGEGVGAIDTTLEVRRVGESQLLVTDGPESESPWGEVVDIGLDGTLKTGAGVPQLTCEFLVEHYGDDQGPDTYEQVAGYPCSEADAALIRFFVLEWFYFG